MNKLRKRMERSYDSDVVVKISVVARQSEDGCEQRETASLSISSRHELLGLTLDQSATPPPVLAHQDQEGSLPDVAGAFHCTVAQKYI